MKKLLIAVLLVMFVFTGVVYAAPSPCAGHYVVVPGDTLRRVSTRLQVSPWDLFRANPFMMAKPNYPIFLGVRMCVPNPTSDKTFPAWVLDQPAATLYPRAVGKNLVITANNFPRNSNWYVKVDGEKIGKIKILNKGSFTKTFKLPAEAKMVCLKNQMTDFSYCQKVIK